MEAEIKTLDPFGFWPRKQSALVPRLQVELGDPGDYAFHTPYSLQAGGPFEFRGTLVGLSGESGALQLSVNELPPDNGAGATTIGTEHFSTAALLNAGGRFKVTVHAKAGHRYALIGRVADGGDAVAADLAIEITGQIGAAAFRRELIAARETIFRKPPLFEGLYQLIEGEPTLARPVSQACTVPQFDEADYGRWLATMKRPLHRHRKQWEFVYILHALHHHGALRAGARGLGFGVGEEPLPAVMAAMGCYVTATDLPAEDARASDWSGTGQHSASLAGISQTDLISDEELAKMVRFEAVDMTRIPERLSDFDFTWSSCALEHVGSIAAGLDFIERSISCLRPGGIAVHTTELNLLSNDKTIDQEGTVLFRRRDFEEISARLILQGHEVMPLNFTSGSSPLDDHIDMPPYSSNDHFKLVMSQYITTSFGVIIKRRDGRHDS